MSVQERREQLLAWMRLRPPYRLATLERLLPGELYDTCWKVKRDLLALRRDGRIYLTQSQRWSVVREAAAA